MIVGQAGFKLFGDFCEHLVWIQRGDGVTRNGVEQRKVPGLGALVIEQPGVFDCDTGFAGQDAQKFQVAFVKNALVVGIYGHRTDGVVVGDERHAAEASRCAQRLDAELLRLAHIIVADEHGLPRPYDVLGEVIAGGASAPRQSLAIHDLEIELDFIAQRVKLGDIEVFHVEEAAQLLPHFPGEVFFVQRRAERPADFIQHVQLFRPPRSLLNQVAVFDRHANLVPERKEKPELRGRKAPTVRCSEKKHSERLFFSLQANGYDAAKALRERQLAKPADRLFFFERRKGVVAEVAEPKQSA